ncbi:hypothetical protein FHR87_001459 [Azomonas macrocytogenes]|uniref:Uncharacterized protein n=1 Tax=Azomonas macrocytogenes TaxID=69962 RepID=A0A839T406_AZOMA|nr:hypothetical protein [Azomonas macrocytogenes]
MPHFTPFKQGSTPLLANDPNVRFFHSIVHEA